MSLKENAPSIQELIEQLKQIGKEFVDLDKPEHGFLAWDLNYVILSLSEFLEKFTEEDFYIKVKARGKKPGETFSVNELRAKAMDMLKRADHGAKQVLEK